MQDYQQSRQYVGLLALGLDSPAEDGHPAAPKRPRCTCQQRGRASESSCPLSLLFEIACGK